MGQDVVEGAATELPEDPGGAGRAVVHVEAAPVDLFPGATPDEVVKQATAVANALKPIVDSKQMAKRIGNRDHLQIEAWQTLGALLKVTPVCVATRRIEPEVSFTVKGRKFSGRGQQRTVTEEYEYEVVGHSYEATVEARTLDGRTIGSATAICSREEDTWKGRDDYALLSMAQTRASSRALASVLRFVVTLAGYAATPAEEMGADPIEVELPAWTKPPEASLVRQLDAALEYALGEQFEGDLKERIGCAEIPAGIARALTFLIATEKQLAEGGVEDEPEPEGDGGGYDSA
jgi:hypothetical protein